MSAHKALFVVRLIFVADTTLRDYFHAFGALGRKIILVTRHTINPVLLWYKAFGSDGSVTRIAQKARLVKLLSLVFHFFHAWLEYLRTFVASGRKRLIIAFAAVQRVVLVAERLVYQRQLAHMAKKALFVPMFVLVGQVFGIGADFFATLFALVGKQVLVASDTIGMVVFEDVARARQRSVTVPARKMLWMNCLTHCFGRLIVVY